MRIGLIGEDFCGKTEILKLLTKKEAALAPFKIYDERLENIALFYKSKKITYPQVEILEIQKPKSKSEEAKFFDNIRKLNLIAYVIKAFDLEFNKKSLLLDFNSFISDILILDEAILEKRIKRLEKEGKKDLEYKVLIKCMKFLEDEIPLNKISFDLHEQKILSGFGLISLIPILVIINLDEKSKDEKEILKLKKNLESRGIEYIEVFGKLENEIEELPEDEKEIFYNDLKIKENFKERFSKKIIKVLDLITFFTANQEEARAYLVKRGITALKAAGKVHSDFEKGFIKAEVIPYDILKNFKEESELKKSGKIKLEGKDYILSDGDIIKFRFHI